MSYEQICAELIKTAVGTMTNSIIEKAVGFLIDGIIPPDQTMANVDQHVRQLVMVHFKAGQDWLEDAEHAPADQQRRAIEQALGEFRKAARLDLVDYPLASAKGHFYVAACYILLGQADNAYSAGQKAYQAAVNIKSVDDKERGRWLGGKPLPEAQRRELEDFLRPLPAFLQQLRNPTLPPPRPPQITPPVSPPPPPPPRSSHQVTSSHLMTGGKIAFDWVTIPAGEFTMGSNDNDREKPIHKVYLAEYQIARVPVTNEQWGMFLQDSGYNWAKRNELWKNGLPRGKEKHPVVWVNWHDSMAFCKWAGVRLPTEAEWEKAARGTDGRKWPWGNNEPTVSLCNFNKNVGDTTPVGNYPSGKSPNGCLDMAGNVWEWCSTAYQAYPYKAGDGREDVTITNNSKVFRGGSWSDNDFNSRAAFRNYYTATFNFSFLGFRCAQ